MTNTTTAAAERVGRSRRRRTIVIAGLSITAWVWAVSGVVHLLALGSLWKLDFLGTKIVFDPQEEAERTAEVEKREAERKRIEEAERVRKQLPEEHARKLKEEADRKAERELVKKVEEIRRTKEELEAIEARKLEELAQRPEDAYRRKLAEDLPAKVREIAKEAERLNAKVEALPVAQAKWDMQEATPKADELVKKLDARLAAPQEQSEEASASVAQAAEALAEKARKANEHAKQAVEAAPPEHKRQAERLVERTGEVVRQAEQVAGKEPVDLSAFNDTSAAEQPPQVADEQLENLDEKSPAELYELAQKLEEDANEAYADARAAELALRQNTTFAEAKEKVASSTLDRPDLAQQLEGSPMNSVGELSAYRENLGKAVAQAESMRVATGTQLAQAQGIDPGAGAAATAGVQTRYAQMMAMQSGAQMSAGQKSLDLSALMRANLGFGGAGIAGSGDSVIYANSNLESGAGYVTAQKLPALSLNKGQITAQAMPGRKFDKDSSRQGWLYIDTWYIIGPFETKGNVRHRESFPPEYEINFDATYAGKEKNGKPRELRWQFTQSDMIRVTPPDEQRDSAYYAFTELYFEDDTDMLLAIASDDAAKVWINDLLVWEDKDLSPWNIGEGFRKVFFRRGYNKVLVRIDNGPVVCQFSVLICPTDAVAAR